MAKTVTFNLTTIGSIPGIKSADAQARLKTGIECLRKGLVGTPYAFTPVYSTTRGTRFISRTLTDARRRSWYAYTDYGANVIVLNRKVISSKTGKVIPWTLERISSTGGIHEGGHIVMRGLSHAQMAPYEVKAKTFLPK